MCGDCLECQAYRAQLLRAPCRPSFVAHPAPTAKALEKHAKRFGPEQVAETAAELGLHVVMERKEARRRRAKGPTLKERVAAYVEAGHSVEVIAELEDLSPGRARRLVEEVR